MRVASGSAESRVITGASSATATTAMRRSCISGMPSIVLSLSSCALLRSENSKPLATLIASISSDGVICLPNLIERQYNSATTIAGITIVTSPDEAFWKMSDAVCESRGDNDFFTVFEGREYLSGLGAELALAVRRHSVHREVTVKIILVVRQLSYDGYSDSELSPLPLGEG